MIDSVKGVCYKLTMPAENEAQARLFRMALAVKRGSRKVADLGISEDGKKKIRKIVKDMTEDEIRDFTKVKEIQLSAKDGMLQLYDFLERQVDQNVALYSPTAGSAERACSNCQFFISPDGCSIVRNWPAPIAPNGKCERFWTALEVYEPSPMEVVIVEDETAEKSFFGKIADAFKSVLGNKPNLENGFTVFIDQKGDYRWMTFVSNNHRDRHKELFTADAHKEFIDYLDNGGEMPELRLWHVPGSKCGKADFGAEINGFTVFSGTFDKDKPHVALNLAKLSAQKALGTSHGYRYTSVEKDGSINWYRTFEISPLPKDQAANPWLSLGTLVKESEHMLTDKKKNFLKSIMKPEDVEAMEKAIDSGTSTLHGFLEGIGVDSKDIERLEADLNAADPNNKGSEGTKDEGPKDKPKGYEDIQTGLKEVSDNIAALSQTLTGVKEAVEKIPSIEQRLDALEKQAEKSVHDLVDQNTAARIKAGINGYVASKSADNVVGDKELKNYQGPQNQTEPITAPFMKSLVGG